MATTPFPLYAAPLTEATEYMGAGVCSLCHRTAADRFGLGIGDDVIYDCEACGGQLAFAADDHDEATAVTGCPHCGEPVTLRLLPDPITACTACLRAGRAALTKDTEFGMVDWEHAMAGHTHGFPGPDRPTAFAVDAAGSAHAVPLPDHPADFPVGPPDEEGWVTVRIPTDVLLELVRTPTYSTWQGERWLFCCGDAMVHVGQWSRADLERLFPGDPEAAFLEIFEGAEAWMLDAHICFYAFRCRHCGRWRGTYDMT